MTKAFSIKEHALERCMLLGSYAFNWHFVGSDKGERVSEAWVPSICKDEMPCRLASDTVGCAEAPLNHGLTQASLQTS